MRNFKVGELLKFQELDKEKFEGKESYKTCRDLGYIKKFRGIGKLGSI